MSMPLSHFIPAYPSPSLCPQVHSLRLHIYSCPLPTNSSIIVCVFECVCVYLCNLFWKIRTWNGLGEELWSWMILNNNSYHLSSVFCTPDIILCISHSNLCFSLLHLSEVSILYLFYKLENWDWEKIKWLACIANSHPSLDSNSCSFLTPHVDPLGQPYLLLLSALFQLLSHFPSC